MLSSPVTTVIDAGGRYGLHPTWKPFKGELHYVLFEPDSVEAERLKVKYGHRSKEIFVEPLALGGETGRLVINFFSNRAMSSSAERKPVSALFVGERASEVEVVESIDVPMLTIDDYCRNVGISVDFLKLDTEGTEYDILQGATHQLESAVLGVRSETTFERVFEGKPLFGVLHEFLLDRDYFLLNIDYDGRGEYQNEFVKVDGRYGVLQLADAVWMLRKSRLFAADLPSREMAVRVMKYAAFCLNNFASDVAVDVLLEARQKRNVDFDLVSDTRLFKHVDISLHRLFYSLKWQPGQSLRRNENAYFEIFGKPMKVKNEFMESLELNPD